jgi:hypothetical protein
MQVSVSAQAADALRHRKRKRKAKIRFIVIPPCSDISYCSYALNIPSQSGGMKKPAETAG